MKKLNELGTGLLDSANGATAVFMGYLPKAITVIIAIIVGYIVAAVVKKIVVKIAKKLKLNELVSKTNTDEQLEKAGIKMDIPSFLGNLAKWIVILGTFMFITNSLQLTAVEVFLNNTLEVIGRIIIALVVFAVAVYAARFVEGIADSVSKYIKVSNSKLVGNIAAGIIYFMAVLVVLDVLQIEVIKNLVLDIVNSAVYGIVIALGIAFGLGGQEKAKEIIEKCKK